MVSVLVLITVALMSAQPLLQNLSKAESGRFEYSVLTATALVEILKLFVSTVLLAVMLAQEPNTRASILSDTPLREFAQYLVPSAIYFCNNNLAYVALQALHPATVQIIGQTKTIFTGAFFRLMLSRRLSAFQWLALCTLACGTAVSQVSSTQADSRLVLLAELSLGLPLVSSSMPLYTLLAQPSSTALVAAPKEEVLPLHAAFGVLVVLFTALLSSLAGVYNELLLKRRMNASIHWQNIQMYMHGAWLNTLAAVVLDGKDIADKGVFHGYNGFAYANVLLTAFMGLSVAAILKYVDNIARVYAHAASLIVVFVFSWPLFGVPITAQVSIAILLVILSTVQYHLPKEFDDNFDRIDLKNDRREVTESTNLLGGKATQP